LILLGLGHRAREEKVADLQVKLLRIRQEVNLNRSGALRSGY
jgi:hypothetical protein